MLKTFACGTFEFGDCRDITSLVNAGSATFFSVAWVLAIIFFAYSGVQFLMSGGDKAKTETAKTSITYSIVGMTILLGLNLIIYIILFTFTGTDGAAPPAVGLP